MRWVIEGFVALATYCVVLPAFVLGTLLGGYFVIMACWYRIGDAVRRPPLKGQDAEPAE